MIFVGKFRDKFYRVMAQATLAADELAKAAQAEGGVQGKGAAYEDILEKYAAKSGLFGEDADFESSRIFRRESEDDSDEDAE